MKKIIYLLVPFLVRSYDVSNTHSPTYNPTHLQNPTHSPTHLRNPTHSPTHLQNPTHSPIHNPTYSPTHNPTHSPTHSPTHLQNPTNSPIHNPTYSPTHNPTHSLTHSPTLLYHGTCFHGLNTVQLKSGKNIYMKDLVLGMEILTADNYFTTSYYTIISLPHHKNNDELATFLNINLENNNNITLTPNHLLPRCDGMVVPARHIVNGDCLNTVNGKQNIYEITDVNLRGVYTAITKNTYIVVNGIIASPYSTY